MSDSLKDLKKAMKKAKKLYKANEDDKELKKKYKHAKKRYREASETTTTSTSSVERKKIDKSSLKDAMEKAKAEGKANRSDKSLREAFLIAKKAFDTGKAPEENPNNVSKVFCSDVPETMDDEKITKYFESCGNVIDTYWLYDKKTGVFRGSGFVTLDSPEAATRAVRMSGQMCEDKNMKITFARPMKSWNGEMHSGKSAGIYIGGLPGDVNKQKLITFFEGCGTIVDVDWREDEDGNFKNCAFLTFDSIASAGKAWKLDGSLLDGSVVNIKPRRPQKKRDASAKPSAKPMKFELSEKPPGCTTCFVGNVAFDLSEDTFAEFVGEGVTNIRWKTDPDTGAFRGFGYVDFESESYVDEFVKKSGSVVGGRPIRIDYAESTKTTNQGGDDDAW